MGRMAVLLFVLLLAGPLAVIELVTAAGRYLYDRLRKGWKHDRSLQDIRATGIAAVISSLIVLVALAILEIPPLLPRLLAPPVRFTELPIPTPGTPADQIVLGLDGALWFTEINANQIGRITTSGQISEFLLPTNHSFPTSIAVGPDGALWFTEAGTDQIGRITTGGRLTEFPLATANCTPSGITAGPDGVLWFTENGADSTVASAPAGKCSSTSSLPPAAPPTASPLAPIAPSGSPRALLKSSANCGHPADAH